jgi:hypothetical protein
MIFRNFLPRDNGATDFKDSARLAGLMALFEHPEFGSSHLSRYFVLIYSAKYGNELLPVRNPDDSESSNPYNFSRDQLIPLAAGLYKMKNEVGQKIYMYHVLKALNKRSSFRALNTIGNDGKEKKFPDGPDLLSPSHRNHLYMCSGEKPSLLGRLWLIADILVSSWFTPLEEPNQIIAMAYVAGPWYVKLLKRANKRLDEAILSYWGGWRGEKDFANFLIKKLK